MGIRLSTRNTGGAAAPQNTKRGCLRAPWFTSETSLSRPVSPPSIFLVLTSLKFFKHLRNIKPRPVSPPSRRSSGGLGCSTLLGRGGFEVDFCVSPDALASRHPDGLQVVQTPCGRALEAQVRCGGRAPVVSLVSARDLCNRNGL